ncbi:AraC family transcriptional regulator [Duganella sp. FT3S]|uniref:AraC family transcriptional regulator n=1 Tax=Rugamonas fusca TaxID=2758568 RepID=A0A7W2I7Z3_9BURK|nr:AraC family transcriptional regulator [Rugamonas fusca]MBA5607011.1 AraC family transcriptional regulator [Rugamonas fusca]
MRSPPPNDFHPALVRARALTGFPQLVADAGGDLAALLDAAGIAPRLLETPDAALPLDQVARLLEHAARVLAMPDLGRRLARRQDISVLGAVALVMGNAPTVGEALLALQRDFAYHSPGAHLELDHGPGAGQVTLRYDLRLGAGVPRRHMLELGYGIGIGFLRLVAPGDWGAWELHFRHAVGPDAEACQRFFGAPVRFGQPCDAAIIPAAVLAHRIASDQGALRQAAERAVRYAIRNHPLDIGAQVRLLAAAQLPSGQLSRAIIASQLGLHEKTLARRLGQQGLVFQQIVDQLRQERAMAYLEEAALPLTEVAALLGYTEQASFIRACRRWFGKTPKALRLV